MAFEVTRGLDVALRVLPGPAGDALRKRIRPLAEALDAPGESGTARRMALIAFAIRVISAAIALLSQIIQARMMGEREYGIYVFVWVLAIIAGNLSCLGFHSAVIRFLPHYRDTSDVARLYGLTFTARIFSMLMASLTAGLGLLALYVFQDKIPAYDIVPLFLALLVLPMIALGDVLDGTARANSWAVTALSPTYIIRPVLILVLMIFAVKAGADSTARTAMLASIAATYLTSIGQLLTVTRRLRRRYKRESHRIDFKLWIKVALPIFLIEGFSFLLTNSDVLVVGIALPPDQVGIYFAASKTMAIVQFVFFAVKAASAPRFSALMAPEHRSDLARAATEAARMTFWPSLAAGLLLLAGGKFLLGLFGSGFVAGYGIMVILLIGLLTKALVGPAEVLLSMTGHQNLCARLYAVALCANIALNITLIPLFGSLGAAMAAAGAMMVEATLLHLTVRRKLGLVLFALMPARRSMPAPKASLP